MPTIIAGLTEIPVQLRNWYIENNRFVGFAENHPKLGDAKIVTSPIGAIDFKRRIARTRSGTLYELGSMDRDYQMELLARFLSVQQLSVRAINQGDMYQDTLANLQLALDDDSWRDRAWSAQ